MDAVQPMRVSDWDRRPYKTLSVASGQAEANCRAVVVITHVDVSDPNVAVLLKRHADASRLEKGNVRFDVLQHTTRANHFTVIETWSPLDERAFKGLDCRASDPFGR